MAEGSFVHRVADLELQPAPLDPDTILEGAPELVLDASPEGRVTRGVWQITPGVVADVEADEFFVVGVLHAGDRAVWRIPRDPPGSLPDHRAGVVHTGSADMSGPPSSLYKEVVQAASEVHVQGGLARHRRPRRHHLAQRRRLRRAAGRRPLRELPGPTGAVHHDRPVQEVEERARVQRAGLREPDRPGLLGDGDLQAQASPLGLGPLNGPS
jgi:hypothetical protein